MTIQKPTVVFDIGAVTLGLNYGKDKNSFFAQASRIAGISLDEFGTWYSEVEKKCLTGEIKANEHYRLLGEKLNQPNMPQEELESLVGLLWTGQIASTIELKQRVHDKGYGVGILSNMTDFCLSIISKKHPEVFVTFGGKKVFSFEHGTVKPDLRLYHEFDQIPGKKVYIDDNLNYAATPLILPGWFGIHHTEFIDASEGIRQVQGDSVGTIDRERLFITGSHKELVHALECCGVKL